MLVSLRSSEADRGAGSGDARDLGYLLHKHPDRVRSIDVGFGRAHVFYPEASASRCTVTLLVEVDPIGLSRGSGSRSARPLEPYVNDRAYVASSMLSVAIGRLFGSAMRGICDARPELVEQPLDLEIELPVLPVRGGREVLTRIFEPLGYEVTAEAIPLDATRPEWGDSIYFSVLLKGRVTAQRALEHLYVLLPVLDDRKHYWVEQSEIDKLLRRGGAWLGTHPESALITRRYLRFGGMAREAIARLTEHGQDADAADAEADQSERDVERPISLNELRLATVMEAVRGLGAGRVMDLGCGEGRLLRRLLDEPAVTELLGVDASTRSLERAARRLRLEEMSHRRRDRVELRQGALTYTDSRLKGFDVATVVEVIEHIDPERLDAFAQALFGFAAPRAVVITTPNREYNANFDNLHPSSFRHGDHRFEWTRAEFAHWAASVADRFGYRFEISGIGTEDPVHGPPTQMAVFQAGEGRP